MFCIICANGNDLPPGEQCPSCGREGFDPYQRYQQRQTMFTMTIGEAVEALRVGSRVARQGWNGRGMWLSLQVPDAHSKMTLPYVYMKTADDKLVPWLCSQSDLLASDWGVVG